VAASMESSSCAPHSLASTGVFCRASPPRSSGRGGVEGFVAMTWPVTSQFWKQLAQRRQMRLHGRVRSCPEGP